MWAKYPDFLTGDTRGGGHTQPLYRVTAPLSHAPQAGWACIQQPRGGTRSLPHSGGHRGAELRALPRWLRAQRGPRRVASSAARRPSPPACRPASQFPPQPRAAEASPAVGPHLCPLRGHPGLLCQSLQWLPEELPAAPRGLLAQSDTPSLGPPAPSWLPAQPRQQG